MWEDQWLMEFNSPMYISHARQGLARETKSHASAKIMQITTSSGSSISKREVPPQHRCIARPYLIAGHSNFHNAPYK